jgi:hypothetical protein
VHRVVPFVILKGTSSIVGAFCVCGEGPRSRSYGRTAALRFIVQPCNEDDEKVMEHWCNEIDRGKPKYSGKNLSQCHFVHHKSHMD